MNMNEMMYDSAVTAIDRLKGAMMYRKTRELHWFSSDGEYLYSAESPLDPEINAEDFGDLPWFRTNELMNGWFVRRIQMARVGIRATLDAKMYVVEPSQIEAVEWEIPTSLFDPNVDDPLAEIELNAHYKEALQSPIELSERDIADLDNAIYDLNQDTQEFVRELRVRRANMTADEKFRERELRRKWETEPPRNETGQKVWWSISLMSVLLTVYADTAEEAIQAVEDEYNHGMELMMFFVSIESDETQEKLEPHKDEKIVRLIPFSNVVWPEDPDNMTDEQRGAFDRLKR